MTFQRGQTALHVAAASARPNSVDWLLARGANAHACDKVPPPSQI